MKRIFKYTQTRPHNTYGEISIEMPRDARAISAIVQNDEIMIYALVDEVSPLNTRHFYIAATGIIIPDEVDKKFIFLNTVQQGPFVWHVFIKPME